MAGSSSGKTKETRIVNRNEEVRGLIACKWHILKNS
jgi:hypothetical protein